MFQRDRGGKYKFPKVNALKTGRRDGHLCLYFQQRIEPLLFNLSLPYLLGLYFYFLKSLIILADFSWFMNVIIEVL